MKPESAYAAAERNVAQLNEITALMTDGGYSVYVKAAVLERSAPAQLDFFQSPTKPVVISDLPQTPPVRETPGQRAKPQSIRETDQWQAKLGVAAADRLARGENP